MLFIVNFGVMKSNFFNILAITMLMFSCSKSDVNPTRIDESAQCSDCNEKTQLILSEPELLRINDDSLFFKYSTSEGITNYRADLFGSLDLDSVFVYEVLDSIQKVIQINATITNLNARRYLIGVYNGADLFQSFVHEIVDNDSTFTLNEYNASGSLLLSGTLNKSNGKFTSIRSFKGSQMTWSQCMRMAWEACQSDWQCAMMCALAGPSCILSIAAACAIHTGITGNSTN